MQKEATIFNFPRQMSKNTNLLRKQKRSATALLFAYMPSLSESDPQQRAAT
jgi:hypothetical protein